MSYWLSNDLGFMLNHIETASDQFFVLPTDECAEYDTTPSSGPTSSRASRRWRVASRTNPAERVECGDRNWPWRRRPERGRSRADLGSPQSGAFDGCDHSSDDLTRRQRFGDGGRMHPARRPTQARRKAVSRPVNRCRRRPGWRGGLGGCCHAGARTSEASVRL
jgi:hypothetical protein